jgi:hypothetical protein
MIEWINIELRASSRNNNRVAINSGKSNLLQMLRQLQNVFKVYSKVSYVSGIYGYPVLLYSLCNPLKCSSNYGHHLL